MPARHLAHLPPDRPPRRVKGPVSRTWQVGTAAVTFRQLPEKTAPPATIAIFPTRAHGFRQAHFQGGPGPGGESGCPRRGRKISLGEFFAARGGDPRRI